jgi:hypothetical protein
MLSRCDAAPQQRLPRRTAAAAALARPRDSAHVGKLTRKRGMPMKVHAPSETVFWIAVALVVLALFGHFVPDIGFLNQYHFWISIAASAVLVLGCIV